MYNHLNGLVTASVDPLGAVREWYYNEHGELELARDPLGHGTLYDYDSRGNLVEVTHPDGGSTQTDYNEHDQPVQATGPAGAVWTWAYDAADNVVERGDPTGTSAHFRLEGGLVTEISDGRGTRTHLRYDAAHQLTHVVAPGEQISSRAYDGLGRLVELTDARGNRQRRRYDATGQLTGVHEADGRERTLAYDGEGNVLLASEGDKQVRFTYAGLRQLASREQAGARVAFEYDREGNLTGLRNEHDERYSFVLDAAGRVATEVGFDGLTRHYERDAAGQVTAVLRPAGRRTAYAYDAAGRVVEVVHNEAERSQYRYRADGALLEATTEAATVQFERNAAGQVLRETQNGHEVSSTYDAAGQRIGLHSSLGASVQFERDARGQVVRTRAGAWQSVVERDQQGLEVQRTLSGGVRTGWQHDGQGRPTGQVVAAPGGAERRRRYYWQGADQLAAIEDSASGRVAFAYDAWDNLAGATYPDGTQELRQPDAVGNHFRSADRSDRRYGQGGQLREAHGTRYKYDEEGQLIRKTLPDGQQWRYAWDGGGQLVKVTRPDGYAVTFAYDALGRRVSKRFRGRATKWVWDGDVPLHEWHELEVGPGAGAAQELATWLFEDGSFAPAAKLTAAGAHSVVCDHLGTQGQYEDVETGLYYNRFRYYDPETGQYASQDPAGLKSRVYNLYAYTANPNAIIDPFGLDWNYVLVDKIGKTCYAGRASDTQSMGDVARRHGNNVGTDGARFGAGDTMRRVTPPGTPVNTVRGIEQRGVSENPLLGRKSPLRRGNAIEGIFVPKQNTLAEKQRLAAADAYLDGKKVSEMLSLSELKFKPCFPV